MQRLFSILLRITKKALKFLFLQLLDFFNYKAILVVNFVINIFIFLVELKNFLFLQLLDFLNKAILVVNSFVGFVTSILIFLVELKNFLRVFPSQEKVINFLDTIIVGVTFVLYFLKMSSI